MKKRSLLLTVIALTGLSACDHYSDKIAALDNDYTPATYSSDVSQIAPAAGASMGAATDAVISGIPFSGHLKREYIEQARYEESVSDYKAAKHYTECAYMLSEGQLVAPASIGAAVPTEERAALEEARATLIEALTTKNMPQNREMLAKAQVSFDCWVDQAAEAKTQSPCHENFVTAMTALAEPNIAEQRYVVLFEENKISLNAGDRETIGGILRNYADKENVIQSIQLVGGSDALSVNRLSVLKSILQYNGIPAAKISQNVKADTSVGLTPIEIVVKERVPEISQEKEAFVAPEIIQTQDPDTPKEF
ncbi:MAG: hypothetical protein HRT94_07870 [Alphaproteobacteria bacterium]|nr:hypothetical protein [Alphaproteobacteria bacterium]